MTTRRMSTAIGMVVVAGTIVGLASCGGGDSTPPAEVRTGQEAEVADIKQACDVFTLDMAKQILGDNAKLSESAAQFSGSSEDLAGSTCTYEAEDPTPANLLGALVTASVTVNGAKTSTGRSSNRYTFDELKTTIQETGEKVETLTGPGDAAYYIGGITNQLHALVDDARYKLIVTARDPDGNNRAATEQLAKLVVERL